MGLNSNWNARIKRNEIKRHETWSWIKQMTIRVGRNPIVSGFNTRLMPAGGDTRLPLHSLTDSASTPDTGVRCCRSAEPGMYGYVTFHSEHHNSFSQPLKYNSENTPQFGTHCLKMHIIFLFCFLPCSSLIYFSSSSNFYFRIIWIIFVMIYIWREPW
jgi:hypothetical protein